MAADADSSTSIPSGGGVSGSQSPMPHGTPVMTKAGPQTSLSLSNHAAPIGTDTTTLHNADSAQSLLRDVHKESESGRGSGSKKGVFQRRSRGSVVNRSGSLHGKHYAKMGLVIDSPTKQATPIRWPRAASESMDISGSVVSEDGEYEVVRLEGGRDLQASPPIGVVSEPLESQGEGPISSPDSGYGNTPDNPGGEDHLSRVGASSLGLSRARASAINESKRIREDTQDDVFGMDASPGKGPTNHTKTRPSPTQCVSPVLGVMHRTTSSSMDGGGSSQDSVLVSASCSSAGDMKEVDLLSRVSNQQSFPLHQPAAYQPNSSRSASTYHRKFRGRTRSSKQLSTEILLRSSKSLSSPPQDRKDYFQVTDELAQENSHLSLSEALLAVIEQYKATYLEQRILEEQLNLPPGFPLPPRHDSSLSTPPSRRDSSLSTPPSRRDSSLSTPPSRHDSSFSTPPSRHDSSFSTPPSRHNSSLSILPPDSLSTPLPEHSSFLSRSPPTPLFLSSWGSLSSVATNDDPKEGRIARTMTRVSLLELMQTQSCDHSAESTAQKLLQSMAGHMTENLKDMSQLSIKLPTDFLISLQSDEDLQKSVTTSAAHMRGNREWAPPRKQIIYNIKQSNKNLQAEVAAQGYRCTGCGMKVDPSHSKNFRFCNYVGKYFCLNCHTNATHIIPAHVLERWSFRKLPVSNFACDLLAKFQDEPVFSINPTQHSVYRKVPVMGQAKDVRAQLVAIRQYLRTCRRASTLNQTFEAMSPWTTDLSSFSMNDFLELRAGVKLKHLKGVLLEAISHVKTCQVCQGKGFVCEFCKNSEDIIFPFEANKVSTCRDCRCCFHKECFAGSEKCPRCERIKERHKQRVRKIVMEAAEEEEYGEDPTFVDPPG